MPPNSDQLSSDLAALRIEHGSRSAPPSHRRWLLVVAAAAAACAVYFVVVPYAAGRLFKTAVSYSEIATVSPAEASTELTATGYVIPRRIAHIGVNVVQARVGRVFVQEGERVAAGQALFQLEDIDLRSALATAETRLAAAKARGALAQANLTELQAQLTRQTRLSERGAAPASTADDLRLRSQALTQAMNAALAETKVAQAEREAAAVALSRFVVRAPFAGVVLGKPPNPGDVVVPAVPLFDLADFNSLIVEADVPEGRLSRVHAGGPCEIQLDAFPSRRLRGEVDAILPRVNRAKATVLVRVRFTDPTDGVLPDMAARVGFLNRPIDASAVKEAPKVVVPGAALAERNGQKIVFVVDTTHDRVNAVSVRLGEALGSGFEVVEGPPPGTRVVRNPPPSLRDGDPIKEKTDE